MTKRTEKTTQADPRSEVLAAIADLKAGYKIGRGILKRFGDRAEHGGHQIDVVAKQCGRSADSLRKLRQFALVYSEAELNALCKLCRDNRRALGISFVYRFVAIKDKRKRAAFQRRAVVEHWGYSRLVRELRATFAHGHRRGRQPQLPDNIDQAAVELELAKRQLVALLRECDRLCREQRDVPKARRLARESKAILAAVNAIGE